MAKLSAEQLETMHRPGRAERFLRWILPLLVLYLDDLLFVAAGVCFTVAAALAFGCSAAFAAAGLCLLGYGIVVARARDGGDSQ